MIKDLRKSNVRQLRESTRKFPFISRQVFESNWAFYANYLSLLHSMSSLPKCNDNELNQKGALLEVDRTPQSGISVIPADFLVNSTQQIGIYQSNNFWLVSAHQTIWRNNRKLESIVIYLFGVNNIINKKKGLSNTKILNHIPFYKLIITLTRLVHPSLKFLWKRSDRFNHLWSSGYSSYSNIWVNESSYLQYILAALSLLMKKQVIRFIQSANTKIILNWTLKIIIINIKYIKK